MGHMVNVQKYFWETLKTVNLQDIGQDKTIDYEIDKNTKSQAVD